MRKCGNCGSKDHDRRTCPEGAAPPAAKLERPAAKAVQTKKGKSREELALELYELDELVALRAAVTAELRARKEQAEAELEKLREVVG